MSARQGSLKTPGAPPAAPAANVAGNERLTGSLGAAVFLLLFVEGLTILRVQRLLSWHVFVGMLLVPLTAAKIGSTAYRFARYYSGREAYVRKGPPPLVLRVLGPFVSVLTVAVLGTGIGAVLDRHARGLLVAHKATFVLWFGAMTVHVLGHLRETPRLALADWRRARRRESGGAAARLAVLGLVIAVAVPLALWSLGWAHHWHHHTAFDR